MPAWHDADLSSAVHVPPRRLLRRRAVERDISGAQPRHRPLSAALGEDRADGRAAKTCCSTIASTGSISESKQTLQLKYMRLACENAWKQSAVRAGIDVRRQMSRGERMDRRRHCSNSTCRFGWWAWNSGNNHGTARKYADGRRSASSPTDVARGGKLSGCGADPQTVDAACFVDERLGPCGCRGRHQRDAHATG